MGRTRVAMFLSGLILLLLCGFVPSSMAQFSGSTSNTGSYISTGQSIAPLSGKTSSSPLAAIVNHANPGRSAGFVQGVGGSGGYSYSVTSGFASDGAALSQDQPLINGIRYFRLQRSGQILLLDLATGEVFLRTNTANNDSVPFSYFTVNFTVKDSSSTVYNIPTTTVDFTRPTSPLSLSRSGSWQGVAQYTTPATNLQVGQFIAAGGFTPYKYTITSGQALASGGSTIPGTVRTENVSGVIYSVLKVSANEVGVNTTTGETYIRYANSNDSRWPYVEINVTATDNSVGTKSVTQSINFR